MRALADETPALVHCTVGKDRTGVTIALALSAAGVDREAVIADYARTETLLPEARNRAVLAALRAQHPGSRHLEELATRSPAAAMREALAEVDARHGSPAGYLRDHGLGDDELRALRGRIIG